MTVDKWIELIVFIVAGIATAIPLIANLVKYIKAATKEKNWTHLLKLLMRLMAQAEEMFEIGADKKTWVLGAVEALSDTIDYDVDIDTVSSMIDALCAMSKVVNAPEKEGEEK